MTPGDKAYVVLERVRKFLKSMNLMHLDSPMKDEYAEVYQDVTDILFDLDMQVGKSKEKQKRG